MTQRISLNPEPPIQGQGVEVCYDFRGTDLSQTTLRVIFDPGGASTDHDVTPASPCVTVSVPGNATSIKVEDLTGDSPDKTSEVDP